MKIIKIFFLIALLASCTTSQINKLNHLNLSKPIQLPEVWQQKVLIQSIISNYCKNFKYYANLIDGCYSFSEINGKGYFLNVYKDDNLNNLLAQIRLIKSQNLNGVYELTLDETFAQYITENPIIINNSEYVSVENIIETNDMLVDKVILTGIPQIAFKKILNKSITRTYAYNQYEEELNLFQLAEDGVILPYNNGQNTKILAADSRYNSIIYFDKDIVGLEGVPFNGTYGYFGGNNNQFANVSGITAGREIQNLFETYYHIYFADRNNNRITTSKFVINGMTPQFAHFDENSFSVVVDGINSPHDVAYFKAEDQEDDKLWFSESYLNLNYLKCFSIDGVKKSKIRGFRYESGGSHHIVYFESSVCPRISVYDDAFKAVAFIYTNESYNSIATFLLNDEGLPSNMYNDSVVNVVHESFNGDYKLTSIHFHKTTEASKLYPYLWVTSGGYSVSPSSIDMIHNFAINKFGGFAYLGSTSTPRNTESNAFFINLLNLALNNDYYDIATIEEWNLNYGVRRYMPFVDLHTENVTDYCLNGDDNMLWSAAFTNDCNIRVRVDRKVPDGNWQPIEIKKVDGQSPLIDPYYVDIYRSKGWTSVTGEDPVDVQVKLPLKDYFFPGVQLRLKVKLFPDYILPNDDDGTDYIYRQYDVDITRNCITEPVGCPFLYVTNEEGDYELDNNIFHKNEFTQVAGDIIDKYKLKVVPQINNGLMEIFLTENENDVSYFDQVKMYAIDYSDHDIMAVTESNDIVTFDPSLVISSDFATYNSKLEITNNINFHNPSGGPIEGDENDNIYAHFPSPDKNSLNHSEKVVLNKLNRRGIKTNGFIAYLGNLSNPVPGPKEKAGILTATSVFKNNIISDFSRRELPSLIALPLFDVSDNVDNVSIDWANDFKLFYVGVANLDFGNYLINEVSLDYAGSITSSSENKITTLVLGVDNEYGVVNEDQLLKLYFDVSSLPEIPPGHKREYVFEATGHYDVGTGLDKFKATNSLPKIFRLYQNYPNPFNPKATIKFDLPKDVQVTIKVYDLLGREVITLVNEFKKTGSYQTEFEASHYASGVYFYRIEAGDFIQSKKMVLVK